MFLDGEREGDAMQVGGLSLTAALWVRIQTSFKNHWIRNIGKKDQTTLVPAKKFQKYKHFLLEKQWLATARKVNSSSLSI
jgi:hypothetical protein